MRAALIILFAITSGHLLWRAVTVSDGSKYIVASEGAALVAPDPDAKNLYLRRLIHVSHPPRHAWLEVIARDRLRVYLNGRLVDGSDRDGLANAALLDITSRLRVGANVIAITARQASFDYPPMVSVRGAYTAADGVTIPLQPDDQWRAATHYEADWARVEFLDGHWPAAAVANASLRSSVRVPPRAIQSDSRAAWISAEDQQTGRVAFRRDFHVAGRPLHAWLRLTMTSAYRLAVNGVLLDERERELATTEPVAPVQRIYDLSPFVRRGENVVSILATRTVASPHLKADLEVVAGDGTIVTGASDAAWQTNVSRPANWMDGVTADAAWQPCRVESGDVGASPWEIPSELVPIAPPLSFVLPRVVTELLLIVAIAFVATVATRMAARPLGEGAYLALAMPGVAIAVAILSTWDPRVDRNTVYQLRFVGLAAISVLLQWIVLAAVRWLPRRPLNIGVVQSEWRVALLLAALIAIGAALRLERIQDEPLQWDEVEHYEYSLGFLERGFPSRQIHPDMPIAYVHTSELMFVPSAITAVFTDDPRLVMRLPAVCFSVLTILLIYVVARTLFTRSVGLVAAATMAIAPVVVSMSTFGRYFAQLQFFTLLTVYGLWLTVRGTGRLNRRALALTATAFVAMFLTWEGSAFIAIGLALAAIVYRRYRLQTVVLEPAIYVALAVVAMLVVLQYSHVVLQQTQFMWYGTSLSDLRIRPMWHYPTFRPWFYVWASSWSVDALLPLIALFAAVLLSARHAFREALRFVLIVYFATCLFMASLLPAMAWRYVHHLIPLAVIAGSAALIAALQRLIHLAQTDATRRWNVGYARVVAVGTAMLAIVASSGVLLDLRELSAFRVDGYDVTRFKAPNLEGPSRYVRDRLQPGDVVLATDPFQVRHFMRDDAAAVRAQFFWPASVLQLSATLDDARPVALDRRDGTPAISDLASMEQLFAQHRRIWYIVQPQRHENQNLAEVSTFLRQHMEVVHEDFEAVVLLRDRNHRQAVLRQVDEAGLGFGNRHRINFPAEPRLRDQ